MKQLIGTVVSSRLPKTAIIKVDSLWQHPLYKKRVKRSKKYAVHDEIGLKEGQLVKIIETRPASKTKKWKVLEVIKK